MYSKRRFLGFVTHFIIIFLLKMLYSKYVINLKVLLKIL
jgi:hypothetical protein